MTICKLFDHRWQKISYPVGSDGERAGLYLRCRRCNKEDHNAGSVARGGGAIA
jgi:hypothetical protein